MHIKNFTSPTGQHPSQDIYQKWISGWFSMVYGRWPHSTANTCCILLKIFRGIHKSCIIYLKKILSSCITFEGSIVVCPKDLGCPKHVAYTVPYFYVMMLEEDEEKEEGQSRCLLEFKTPL